MRMNPTRLIFLALLLFAMTACGKNQPSGIPETPPAAPALPAAPAPPPEANPVVQAVAPVDSAPPPLDNPIPAFDKTGFPDCDDYIETYRQCLNSRLGSDERRAKASELKASVRAILGNIARGVDPARVAKQCKKSRALAAKKLEALGCTL
jgi:hypothetical protein